MQNDTLKALSQLTENLPIGKNLGLLHFLWMLVSGALLVNRGVLFPALQSIGLEDSAVRRAWVAFGKGKWHMSDLLSPEAQRALPAVIFGLVGQVGEVNGQRLALPHTFERVHPKDPSEVWLWAEVLKRVQKDLADDEIAVLDAGVKIRDLQAAKITRYVLRLVTNFTARRNALPCGGRLAHPS